MSQPQPEPFLVFERLPEDRLPAWWSMALFAVVVAVAMVTFLVSGAVDWLRTALPFASPRALIGSMTLACLLAAVAFAVRHESRLARCYGACLVSPYRVWSFGREGGTPSLIREIAQEDVRSWERTPNGLILEVEGDGPVYRRLSPTLLPAIGDAEVTLAECLLRGEDPRALGLTSEEALREGAQLAAELARGRAEWESLRRTLGLSPPE